MKRKDSYRAALGSGHFPLTFNFAFKQDGRFIQCSFCGKFIHYRYITRDHVYPKSKGGTLKAPACQDCNIAKQDMLPLEWALYSYKHNRDIAGAVYHPPFELREVREEILSTLAHLFGSLIDDKDDQEEAA